PRAAAAPRGDRIVRGPGTSKLAVPRGFGGDDPIHGRPESRARGSPPGGGVPDDAECVRRARGGDHEAFRLLVERYQGRAHRLALRILRDDEAARDAVQEAFVKAYASLDRFEERASFFTWLYRLVTNQCIDQRRREHRDRRVEWSEGDALEEGLL